MVDSGQKEKINILFVLDNLNLGGAERQAFLLAQALNNTDQYDVKIVFLSAEGNSIEDVKVRDLDTQIIPFRFRKFSVHRIIEMVRYAFLLRSLRPDIILPFTIRPNVTINFAWQLSGAKACCWNQRDEGFGFPIAQDKIFNWAFKNAQVHIANSNSTVETLKKLNHQGIVIRLINNGMKFTDVPTLPFSFERKVDRCIITMVANLTTKKDHLTLVKALLLLKESLAEDTPILVLAGAFGDNYLNLKRFVDDNDMQDDVVFAGQILDIKGLLSMTDISVNSSFSEGMPNSVLEYMLAGKPVVASKISAHQELLGDQYRYFFEPGDEETLAAMLLELINSPEKRNACGQANEERFSKRYDLNKMADNYKRLFKDLISN